MANDEAATAQAAPDENGNAENTEQAAPTAPTTPPDPVQDDGQDASQTYAPLTEQPTIALSRVRPDPDNPRENLSITPQWVAELEGDGKVLVPLLVRPDPAEPGAVIVVEGHRRYFGALEAGLTEVPYALVGDLSDAERFMTMYRTNHPETRINHNAHEQILAFNAAYEAGMTRREMKRRLGLTEQQIDEILAAGKVSKKTVADLGLKDGSWNIPSGPCSPSSTTAPSSPPRTSRRWRGPRAMAVTWTRSRRSCGCGVRCTSSISAWWPNSATTAWPSMTTCPPPACRWATCAPTTPTS